MFVHLTTTIPPGHSPHQKYGRDFSGVHQMFVNLEVCSKIFLAKFSFDILGINAEKLKVNKCSHKNKSEQMSI